MQITVSSRRTELPDTLKEYSREKSGKLNRYYDRVQSVEVVFDVDGKDHTCEIIARADHHTTFVARERHEDAFGALDGAAKELERQLTRHKEKFRNRKHTGGGPPRQPLARAELSDSGQSESEAP